MKLDRIRRESEISREYDRFKSGVFLPSCIFSKKLTSFETVCKFLREDYGFSFDRISLLVGRQKSSVYRAYKKASEKSPERFCIENLYFIFPVDILQDPELSTLESLAVFLKRQYSLSFSNISALLMRSESTVRTAYNRAMEKMRQSKIR